MHLGQKSVPGRPLRYEVEDGLMPFAPGFELVERTERLRRKSLLCHCLLRLLAEGIPVRPAAPERKNTLGQRISRPRYADKLSPCQLYSIFGHRSASSSRRCP